jgi:antirestriction protein
MSKPNTDTLNAFLDEHTTHLSAEVVSLWMENLHEAEPTREILDQAEDAYIGEFRDFTRLAEHLVDETGMLSGIPSEIANYFDYEKYGNDLRLGGDAWESEGHFFYNR